MLRKMLYRKTIVASSLLLVILMLYFIPTNKEEIEIKNQTLEYIYPNDLEVIYLLDEYNYLSRTKISASNKDIISKSTDLIETLTIDGKKKDIISNGFKALIPKGTKLLNLSLKDNILSINFSNEFNNIEEEYEEKLIESLTYTLTSIDGIDKVIIKVDGEILNKLPSGKKIPSILDRSYGINKSYDLVNTSNIESYTVYYVNEYNDNSYYVPVTKYVNGKSEDPIKIIIKELSSSPIYETNLMSYLNANAILNDYEFIEGNLKLNFNELLLNDLDEKNILEEVIYTIGLSINDVYDDLETVSFYVDNNEVYNLNLTEME